MQFAIILLVILAAACALGSFITQGQEYAWYEAMYSKTAAGAIMLFGLDDVFHSLWFVVLTAFLCLNLLLCSVLRFPAVLKQYRETADPQRLLKKAGTAGDETYRTGSADRVFSEMGMRSVKEGTDESGRPYRFACRGRLGVWGSWLCHVGILILILGFGLGQMTKKEYTVYGVPGQSKQIGDTDYVLTIEDFDIALREDDTVEQYTAEITVRDIPEGTSRNAQISVNHPQRLYGMKFYQNSTGWAATVTVLRGEEILQQQVVCAGESLQVKDQEGLEIYFSAFYPDYYRNPDGTMVTLSSALNNPGYLYRASYMGSVIGMNVLTGGDYITIDDFTVTFTDPQPYTLIQVKTDHFTYVALVGGLLILVSLMLAFYVQPRSVAAIQGTDGAWTVAGYSRRGGVLFAQQLKEAVKGKERQ